jgi:ribosomal-protein-alanine N-acetyltransferase
MSFGDPFKTYPILQTPRLLLDKLVPDDAEAYHRQQQTAASVPNRPPWTFGFEMESVDHTRKSIAFAHNAWKKKARLAWALRLRTKAKPLIGCCIFYDFQNQAMAETGYWLGAKYHKQGYMTEAMRVALVYVFETMGLHRVYAYTSVENMPSIALLKKVGFQREGVLRQHAKRGTERWGDTAVLAILKGELIVPAG